MNKPKLLGRITLLAVSCGLVVVWAGCASHSPDQGYAILPCKVLRLKGQARWRSTPDGEWQKLKLGQSVKPGVEMETAADSRVDIAFADSAINEQSTPRGTASALDRTDAPQRVTRPNSLQPPPSMLSWSPRPLSYTPQRAWQLVRVWENSRLMFTRLEQAKTGYYDIHNVQLDLQAGHIFGSVKKMPATSSYEIKIPTGVAQIRGTTFDINVDGIIKLLDGSIFITYTNRHGEAASQMITGQQMFDARTGVLSDLPVADRTGMPLVLMHDGF